MEKTQIETSGMSSQESLDIISQMIKKARNSYLDTGFSPMLWGAAITTCALCSILFRWLRVPTELNAWYLIFIPMFIQLFYERNKKKNAAIKTYNESAMDVVWGAFGITIMLGTFLKPFIEYQLGVKDYESINVFAIFLLYGIPTFVTGGIMKFKPMIYGGIICWLMAIASSFIKAIPHEATYNNLGNGLTLKYTLYMLCTAIAGISAWLVPGIILRKMYLKAQQT
jgi:hypothetical protein